MKPLRLPLRLISFVFILVAAAAVARAEDPPQYVLEWGSSGSGNGQFNNASCIAIDAGGFIYSVEAHGHRVQKFDGNGTFIMKWGTYGGTDGKFNQPHGISADALGNIWVADSGNHRIQKFTSGGVFVSAFGSEGTGDGEFKAPRGIAVDAGGNIFVSDTFNNRVQKLSSAGEFITKWGSPGTGAGQFNGNVGISVDNAGIVYVVDTNNDRVQKFDNNGSFLAQWGTTGTASGQFSGMSHLCFDGPSIYVSDQVRVQKFTTAGVFLAKWGYAGSGPGQFGNQRGVAADGLGNVWTCEYENNRIQKFAPGIPPDNEGTLTVGTGRGLPGPVSVPVSLSSIVPARGLEFVIDDAPDWFEVTGVATTGRASAMLASFADDGDVHVVVYSLTGALIQPGTGDIVRLTGTIKPEAVEGDSTVLTVTSVLMPDDNNDPADIESAGGRILIERVPGDINGDNEIDAGDVVRLLEIILGTGDPPSSTELELADCNEDAAVNIFDVSCEVDLILNGPSGPPEALEPLGAEFFDFAIRAEQPVKAVQLRFAGDGADVTSTGDLSPLQMVTGVDAAGDRIVMVFDARGGSWPAGVRAPLRLDRGPAEIRAYGSGGRALPVVADGSGIRIGTPLPVGLRVHPSLPNPFLSRTTIRFSIDTAGPVTLSVYDIRGALVSSPEVRQMGAGEQTWEWKARNENGTPLPAGIYLALVDGLGQKVPVRLVVMGR